MLGVNKIHYKTTIYDKWDQHMDWGPLNRFLHTQEHDRNYHHPYELLQRSIGWDRNLPVLPLLVALCSMSTHILHTGRGSFYWHCLNCIVTVQWLSTLAHQHRVLLIREGMHNRERELRTHEHCFSDAQHKNLIKIVPEWWCEKHPAKSVINIKFISYISTMYHLSFRSTLHIVGTQMNPQIRTDLYWNLTFLLASHSFKLQP